LATGPAHGGDGLVIDADSGTVRLRLTGDLGDGSAVRWSPDSKALVLFDEDRRRVSVWDAATGHRLRERTLGAFWPGLPICSPNGQVMAWNRGFEVGVSDGQGAPLGVLLPFDVFGQLAVTADGHFRGNARVERLIRMVVQKQDGTSETLTPAEFERKYGWKNDPGQVRLAD
jgi:hypothetical protein